MIKILHIPTGGLFSDGIFNCMIAYLTYLDKSDISVDILAVNETSTDIIDEINNIACGLKKLPYRKNNTIKYFLNLIILIKQEQYDIVHVHGSSAIMSIELLAAKIAGCKIRIAHSHNTTCKNIKTDKILRFIFMKLYTQAFACGTDAGKWLFKDKKFIVLPNGRNLNKYAFSESMRLQLRRKFGISEKNLVIGHIGRFNLQKNHKFLLKIFKELKKININSKLILIGTGELFNEIKNQSRNLGIFKDVIFMGVVNNVHELLSVMDIMVLPSLYEGLPLVLIECQAAGLPCIISDTITDECIIENNIVKISLNVSPAVWAKKISEIELKNRMLSKEKIKYKLQTAGYDIECDAKLLKKYYQEFILKS